MNATQLVVLVVLGFAWWIGFHGHTPIGANPDPPKKCKKKKK